MTQYPYNTPENIQKAQLLALAAREARAQGDWEGARKLEAQMDDLYDRMAQQLEVTVRRREQAEMEIGR